MLDQIPLLRTLFLDIETVPYQASLHALSPYEQELWEEKRGKNREEGVDAEQYFFDNSGILAEFGKIVCISAGYFIENGGQLNFRVKSLYGDDEKAILSSFITLLQKFDDAFKGQMVICGHNIREFDVPFICRRLIINNMINDFPPFFQRIQMAKPWDVPVLDTMDTWRFGDYKNYISLKLLAHCLGIPSPKDDISGKDVGKVYYLENGIDRIRVYCQKDVVTLAQIVLRLKGKPLLLPEQIFEI